MLSTVALALRFVAPGPFDFIAADNPVALSFLPDVSRTLGVVPEILLLRAGVVHVVRRCALSRGEERQQLKWFTYAGVLAVATWAIASVWNYTAISSVLYSAGLTAIPVAIGIAILKYRLWEIDSLINRTLVYVPLTAALAGLYSVGVLVIGTGLHQITGQGSGISVALSTLAVVALFRPLRDRSQPLIDRRFYRRRRAVPSHRSSAGIHLIVWMFTETSWDLVADLRCFHTPTEVAARACGAAIEFRFATRDDLPATVHLQEWHFPNWTGYFRSITDLRTVLIGTDLSGKIVASVILS